MKENQGRTSTYAMKADRPAGRPGKAEMKPERIQRWSPATPAPDMTVSELKRCLRQLVTLFPDPAFRARPPEIVLEPGYPPLPEDAVESEACIPLCHRDLVGSASEVLTILLHKTIHAFHAFSWLRDCTCWSYHTQTFRRLAQQVGFQVGWAGRRYGWAQTRPGRSLERLFEGLALSLPAGEPVGWRRRRLWHCGALRFPGRADLERRLGRRDGGDPRRLVRSLRVHRRGDAPMVRLSGRWLAAFDFERGVRLKVEARPGRLVLEARPEARR
jgi:hypothetical protein